MFQVLSTSSSTLQGQAQGRIHPTNLEISTQGYHSSHLSNLVGNIGTEIPDDVVEAALNLIRAHADPALAHKIGYLTPAQLQFLLQNPQDAQQVIPVPRGHMSINIHYISHHWVTSVFNPNTRRVTVYDSLRSRCNLLAVFPQLRIIYGIQSLQDVHYPIVTQQSADPICGAMAIAFAPVSLDKIHAIKITIYHV